MKTAVFIPLELLENEEIPFFVKLIYGRVACMLDKKDRVVMSTDELAIQCGITRRNAAKALPELVRLGLIKEHKSLTGHGIRRVFERQEPIEADAKRHSEPKKSNSSRNNDLPKKPEEN